MLASRIVRMTTTSLGSKDNKSTKDRYV